MHSAEQGSDPEPGHTNIKRMLRLHNVMPVYGSVIRDIKRHGVEPGGQLTKDEEARALEELSGRGIGREYTVTARQIIDEVERARNSVFKY